ncbi:DNA-binding protein [Myriangium duriaei CBS 260.36]|uniref:DNA-binding protein n=1 Tax=Myriangium duriaei CBS 260.36 TaxID=1168546 RepID=A0A9P4JBI2_9PEZI|nr:DNA-binding protein [Myriangium duriaei CBS 260.36]
MSDSTATFTSLIHTFTAFLTISIHTILYERHIYPASSFLSTRAYNYPVRQSRHPRVCAWITDAVSSVETELLKSSVSSIAVVIYSPANRPLERFVFDVARFPLVPLAEANTPLQRVDAQGNAVEVLPQGDLEEQFRGAMSRLSGCGARLKEIPEGCTFTVAVELKDESEAPLGEPQAWIPVQPGMQKSVRKDGNEVRVEYGDERVGARTIPVRTIVAGEMMFEMWIEEGRTKFQPTIGDDAHEAEPG